MTPPSLPVSADDFYETLVENASEGMLTIDQDSQIVYANAAVEDILGYTPEELVGSSKMKIIPERLQSVHAAALRSYVESGEKNIDWDGIELPALHRDGHEVPTLISLREHWHDGEQFFTGIIRDISDRRKREQTLQAQRDRLDQFADILAHDIRNPLSVAMAYTEVAREENESDIPELDHVSESLDRLDEIVEHVLSLSKEGLLIGETEPVDLADCVRESWESTDTCRADLSTGAELGVVEADRSRVQELLENVFRNAVEHGGEDVTVEVGRLSADGGFYVADDGPGIAESIRDEVLKHGYSTGDRGTGYGLSIVEQIAAAHGWEITITESDGGGARFEFSGLTFV